MNITDNLIRIKEGKDNIIKSLKNKGVDINDNTLINEIPTIIDNAEIGGGGGDTPVQPDVPELVQKYEGATVFRIVVLKDECEIGFAPFWRNQNSQKISYVIDWGDGTIEEIDTDSHIYHIYNIKGVYDINCYNFNYEHFIYTNKEIECVNGKQYLNAFDNPKNDSYSFVYNNNKEYDYMCTNILVGSNLEVYNISNNPYLETIYITYIPTSSSLSSAYYKYQNNTKLRIFKTDFNLYVDRGDFSNCISLESIITPNGVTLMNESSLFSGCKQLKNILLKFDSYYKKIPSNTFQNCSSLTSINIPETVTSIGSYAFSGCSSLTSINIPETVTSIDNYLFSGCSSLTSINIPETVTSIGNYAFQNCSRLQNISIPNGVTSIWQYTFYNCSSLTSINIPETVTSIGNYAFQNCSSLTSINIPETVTSIGSYAFSGCSSLQNISIPNSVTSIGSSVFSGCSSLQNISIPNSVTSISSSAFSNCTCLQSIILESLTAPTIQSSSFPTSNLKYTKRYLYVSKDSVGYDSGNFKTYLIDKGWELRYIEDKPEKVPITLKLKTKNNFFHNLQAIGQANLINYELINDEYIYNFDDKIIELIQYTFYNNVLEEIELPESVEIIGNNVFSNSYYLQSITCKAMIAPTIQSNTFNSVGSKVPSGTPKILRVPEGSEGYDAWLSKLSGFTLEYI